MPKKVRGTSLVALTSDQLGEAAVPFVQVAAALTPDQAQYCVSNKVGVRKRLMAMVNRFPVSIKTTGDGAVTEPTFDPAFDLDKIVSDRKECWLKYYRDILDLKIGDRNFANLIIPPYQEGFNKLVIMVRGLYANGYYSGCQKQFACWRYTENLDQVYSDRLAVSRHYALWMEDIIEPREEFGKKSANDLVAVDFKGIALPERLADEGEHYFRTKTHRDVENITRCDGSRNPGGYVPRVYWCPGCSKLYVSWCYPDDVSSGLRSRPVSC